MYGELPGYSAREKAFLLLCGIEQTGAYANLELRRSLSGDARDRALITDLVYGTIRMRGESDFILSQLVHAPLDKIHPPILNILRMGLYQLRRHNAAKPWAVADESVKLAKKYGHKGTAGLVNAALRAYIRNPGAIVFPDANREPHKYLSAVYSLPLWMAGYFNKLWGFKSAEAFCAFINERPSVSIRVNTAKITRDDLFSVLESEGVSAIPGRYAPEAAVLNEAGEVDALPSFNWGLFAVQGETSVLASLALSPSPDSLVIDMCAAPGGKTAHLAQMMENRGEIRAFDIYPHKIALIEDNCRRQGCGIVRAELRDARTLPLDYAGKADYVLLDAPCTGLGVLNRRADARWKKKYEDIAESAELGCLLLNAGADCLRPGGVMIFSTCTVTRQENMDNVRRFLADRPDMEADSLDALLPFFANGSARTELKSGMIQFLPQEHGIEGFFIARLKKRG